MRIFVGRLRSNGQTYLFSREEKFFGSLKCGDFQALARNVYGQFAQLGKLPEKVQKTDVIFSVAEEEKHAHPGSDPCEYLDLTETEQEQFWEEFRKLTKKAS